MTMTKEELLARWPTDIPFKGSLISDDGCMCAQGQVLHYVGGMSPYDLREIDQEDADKHTAELLGISRAHAVLLRHVNDGQPGAPTCVLTEPEKILGDQAQIVLAFWRHFDRMTEAEWQSVYAAEIAAEDAAEIAARDAAEIAAGYAARDAARDAAWAAARDAAWAAAWSAARDAAGNWSASDAAAGASTEIQGAAVMRANGQPFYFLPMFGFASPEDIQP
jgi:hypothetical protein